MEDTQNETTQPDENRLEIPNLISFNTTAPEATQDAPTQASAPEMPSAYQSIIDQQNAQIAALMEHNANLNKQIAQMVQNGAQFNQGIQQPQVGQGWAVQPPSLADNVDTSLQSLATEIGKK